MGRLTALLALASFVVGAGAAYLSGPAWIDCLGILAILLPLTAFAALGWFLKRRLAGWPDRAWSLVTGAVALAVVAAVYLWAARSAPDPQAPPVSIPLVAWSLSGGRIAALVAALGFGLYGLGAEGRGVRLLAAGVAVIAFLAGQPLLAARGVPVVGPVGLGLAILVLAGAGWIRRRRGAAGPGGQDPP